MEQQRSEQDSSFGTELKPRTMTLMKTDIVLPYIILAMCIGNIFLLVCYSFLALFDLHWQFFILGFCFLDRLEHENKMTAKYKCFTVILQTSTNNIKAIIGRAAIQ